MVRQVFSTDSVTAYWIAYRSAELVNNLLGEVYDGWLMSDGYGVYRQYRNRLRCWAHLLRKARGLEESLDRAAQRFGTQTLELLGTLIAAIQEARGSPPDTPLTETFQAQLTAYRRLCEQMKTGFHKQTRELANEMLNDWEAIFRILQVPDLPLTNNEAERALRHWGQSCEESLMALVPNKAHGSLLPIDQRHRNLPETTAITLDLFDCCHPQLPRRTCHSKSAGC